MGNCCRGFEDARFTNKNYQEEVVLAQLPQELITEVLMRVPVNSLLRFRCVSKSFCAIIDSQYFAKLHMIKSPEGRSHLKLIFPAWNHISTNYNTAKLRGCDFYSRGLRCCDVYGYCNGVFLVSVNRSQLILWNPSTHKYSSLPCSYGLSVVAMSGLGYDSSRDDYKVVLIETLNYEHRVHVFGLRSNSWSRFFSNFTLREEGSFYNCSRFGHFAHGDLHWLHGEITELKIVKHIVAFDLAKETFSVVSQPADYLVDEKCTYLDVLDGCLCVGYCSYGEYLDGEARLYVRKKDGAEFKWSLLYSIMRYLLPPFMKEVKFDKGSILGYSKERDMIMFDFCLGHIVSYDLKQKNFRPTEIKIPARSMAARSLVESLESMSRGESQ